MHECAAVAFVAVTVIALHDTPLKESTINGPRTRRWALETRECPELAAFHIARIGIDRAFHPYRRVRLRPAGSFFLASLEGEGRVLLQGRWQRITKGILCMAPPRVLNALYAPPNTRWVFAWVRYDEPVWIKPLVGAASPLRAPDGAEQLGRAIAGLRAEWAEQRDAALVHHWVSLVHGLARRIAKPWRTGSRVGLLWEVVARELAADWKVATLAARANVSVEHLRRLCLRELGRTPMAHVAYMRVHRAQELLETTEDKIDSIARQVGIGSGTVFTRVFTRFVGITPSMYRASR